MPSKQQDVAKSNISPVLFMAVDGEPMSFFLRPGPIKLQLQPLIIAGGGKMCNIQQPGAILLIDPDERGSIPETTAHWYVSTKYIHDCIEKDEQMSLEDYRLHPEVVPRQSARLTDNKERAPELLGGRIPYTTEDDAAIWSYVSKRKTEIGGNRLWQEMERQRVTSHSWQSMKYRYRVRLAKKQSEVVEVAAAEREIKVEENQETDVEKPSRAEDAASPQTHSTESDQTQIDDQFIPAESTQPETVEAQTSVSTEGEVQHVNPQTDKQPAGSTQVETEVSNSPQPEGPCLDTQTDAPPLPAESTEPGTDETQTKVSPQKDSVPVDSPPAQPKSLPSTSSQKKPKEKQKSSPRLEQPLRRLTRRQLQLDESPEPYGKKLRSSSSSAEQPSSSPQPLRKTKAAVKSALQKDTTVDQPPSKRAREKTVSETESQQEEIGQATVPETAQADTESDAVPQKAEKKKEKRKLGILELATKEFEDENESDEDETPDLQNPSETATMQPTSTKPPVPSSDPAVSTQSNPEHGPSLQENVQENQASGSKCLPETGCPVPAAAEPAVVVPAVVVPAATEPAATEPAANEPAAAEPAAIKPSAVKATSKAHLFIFDNESQEEDSESVVGDNISNLQPRVNKDAAFSLTQVQLEEDKQLIRELMKQANQDLVSVTKALLKTSGDFSAALDLLLDPLSISGPFWKRSDDALLRSGDPAVQQQLQEKFSEEEVAKRIVFLEIEG
ncbi:telomeric repeat-binding factor 2-interacting protein 1 isoform X2 [Dicentrarchus labrax]|uniref:telomeric repeat-binding factor 2-interacting protein 1 isoform X2 n=1 Tax=Dicentrarchus labrax TaxID=13489 RepID=UPI0021F66B1A|nr:telomeric repeat-binding factor 2-interacting protein 1 isoform X2 [Dicentrarchus labrax]